MDFLIQRDPYTIDSAPGEMIGSDGASFFYTIERLFDGKPKVAPGTYDCQLYNSPHFGYPVFMLLGVAGHDHIEIHPANTYLDLDGCIGIGLARANDAIYESDKAFEDFMKLQNKKSFKLTIEG